jgi:DNA polymerase III gamma/tau subunit
MVDYLRGLMLARLGGASLVDTTTELRAVMSRQAAQWSPPALLRAIRAFTTAVTEAKGGWQPQLPLELAVMECCAAATSPAPAAEPARPAEPAPTRARAPEPASTAATPRPRATPARKTAEKNAAAGSTSTAPAELKPKWDKVLTRMREQDKLTEAVLRSCSVLGLEGGVLRVATHSLVYQKINGNSEILQLIDRLLTEEFGFACSLKFQLVDNGARTPDSRDLPPDGMVATALRDLGGEIAE